jgi:hypothetical protein
MKHLMPIGHTHSILSHTNNLTQCGSRVFRASGLLSSQRSCLKQWHCVQPDISKTCLEMRLHVGWKLQSLSSNLFACYCWVHHVLTPAIFRNHIEGSTLKILMNPASSYGLQKRSSRSSTLTHYRISEVLWNNDLLIFPNMQTTNMKSCGETIWQNKYNNATNNKNNVTVPSFTNVDTVIPTDTLSWF